MRPMMCTASLRRWRVRLHLPLGESQFPSRCVFLPHHHAHIWDNYTRPPLGQGPHLVPSCHREGWSLAGILTIHFGGVSVATGICKPAGAPTQLHVPTCSGTVPLTQNLSISGQPSPALRSKPGSGLECSSVADPGLHFLLKGDTLGHAGLDTTDT